MKNLSTKSNINEIEILTFYIGETLCGIQISEILEIASPQKVVPLPGTSEMIDGIYYCRGEVVPVINLLNFFDISCYPNNKEMFVVAIICNKHIAFRVGKVCAIGCFPYEEIKAPPKILASKEDILPKYVSGIINHSDEMIMMINFENITSEFLNSQITHKKI